MPITKNSTEALLSLQLTINRLWESLVDMKLHLDYLCNHIEWKDKVGLNFIEQYQQNMKVVQDKLLPKFDRYDQYLCQLIEIVDDYTSMINANGYITGAPSIPPSPKEGFSSADDPDFQNETEERIKRLGEYAGFPENQQTYMKLDKDELKDKLEEAMRREDSIAYHKYRLSYPDSPSLHNLQRETKIVIAGKEKFQSVSSLAKYFPADNIIYVNNELWDKETNNMTLFSAIMHEYEHKQQNDATLRGEVIKDAMKPAIVESWCLKELDNVENEEISQDCEKQLEAYFNEPKETRSFKAQEIAEDYYRNPKFNH